MNIPKLLLLTAATLAASLFPNQIAAQPSSNVHVWVTGLNGPRGLKFGPDGKLYVAEAGTGGTTSTKGACAQVIAPGWSLHWRQYQPHLQHQLCRNAHHRCFRLSFHR